MKTKVDRGPLLFLVLLSSSCVTPSSLARTRASNEFKCPNEQVVLKWRPELTEGTYDVEACGHRARYSCVAIKHHRACVREPLDEAVAKPSPSP